MPYQNLTFTGVYDVITVIPDGGSPITVGGAESISIDMRRKVNSRVELGNHMPVELVESYISEISFDLDRAYIDTTLIADLGFYDVSEVYFDIHCDIQGNKNVKRITLYGCKLTEASVTDINNGGGYAKRRIRGLALGFKEE